jgi:hypothetical protein
MGPTHSFLGRTPTKQPAAEAVAGPGLRRVGAPGFEPGTFWSQSNSTWSRVTTKCSIHAMFWASVS